MNFFTQILGRAKPTSDNITKKLADVGGEIATAQTRLATVEGTLRNLAVLSDTEHASAEAEQDSLRRLLARLEAQVSELQKGLVEAQEAERLADLKARAEAARRRVETDAPKLLDSYEVTTRAIVEAVSELQAIDVEVEAVNAELRKAGLDLIQTVENRYRREPDQVIPEVRTKRKKWVRRDRWGGEQDVSITIERDGRQLPSDGHGVLGDAYEVEVEDVTPARRTPGRWLEGLAGSVRLPPARIGSAWHWPKG